MCNYRKINLQIVPDCCLSCAYGDWDGEVCGVLLDNGFGSHIRSIDDGFVDGFFHVCDKFERARWAINQEIQP